MPEAAVGLCVVPFVLQGAATLFDEFYFHHRRGLARWEAYGHPLDTLTVALAFSVLVAFPPGAAALWAYGILSAFSCVFVTKDEFVHRTACAAGEQWLHAVLFLLHPMVFFAAGFLWWQERGTGILGFQLALLAAFGVYQLCYWVIFRGYREASAGQ